MNNLVKNKKAYLYIFPAMLFITVFVIYPILNSFILSLQNAKGSFSFASYQFVLNDPKFHQALINTFIYAIIVTPTIIFLALVVSYCLSLNVKLKNFFQTLFFLPYVTSTLAIGLVFAWMYHSNYGVFNSMLMSIGLQPMQWLNDPKLALPSVIIFGIWKGLAFNILILFTAIQSIDGNLEKAALVDGANSVRTFVKIKLPQIVPVLVYLLVINVISSLKVYEEVVSLFGVNTAGVDNSAITAVFYIFQKLRVSNSPQIAAASAIALFVIILLITMINNFITKRAGGNNGK